MTRTTGKNPACTTGANTALNTRVWPGELCTPGTVAVIFKRDWPVQDFFSRTGEVRPCYVRSGPGSLCTQPNGWIQKRSHTQKSHPKMVNPRDIAAERRRRRKSLLYITADRHAWVYVTSRMKDGIKLRTRIEMGWLPARGPRCCLGSQTDLFNWPRIDLGSERTDW